MEPDERAELEEQFILRLPQEDASKLRQMLHSKPDKIKKQLKIDLDVERGQGLVYFGKKMLYGVLKKFPTIIESHKTNISNNKSCLTKTADICQIMICSAEPPSEEGVKAKDYPHGFTPPMKNVRKNRFRKTLVNADQAIEVESVTKELFYILRTDMEAISTRFEVSSHPTQEEVLFGQLSSDSEPSTQSS